MTNYGTLIDGFIHPAPRAFMLHGAMVTNPKAEHFAAFNEERATYGLPPYLEFIDKPPATTEGFSAVPTEWQQADGKWVRQYEVRELPPPPPRTFDKYRLVDALMRRNVWEQVKTWLQSTPNAYDRAVMAPDISEDEQLLADGIAAVKQLLGWTDEQVEAVLSASAI